MTLDPTRQATAAHSSGTAAIDVSVAWVQQRLNLFRRTTGQTPIAVDGVAGPATAAATHDFLVRLGVPPNGVLAGQLYDVANTGTPGRVRMTIPVESALDGRAPGATPGRTSAAGASSMLPLLGVAAVAIAAFAYTSDKRSSAFRGLGNAKAYWTVVIPYSNTPTGWHPTARTGPFSQITRGAFGSPAEARAWAKRNLRGNPYSVRRIK